MQHIVIITTAYGKPFTVDGFSGWMRDAISEAGLPLDCRPHGLRKAAGRLLAEAGATAKMIMSVLGHNTLAEAERYMVRNLREVLPLSASFKHVAFVTRLKHNLGPFEAYGNGHQARAC